MTICDDHKRAIASGPGASADSLVDKTIRFCGCKLDRRFAGTDRAGILGDVVVAVPEVMQTIKLVAKTSPT
jgi:hypothetical protein